MPTSSLQLLQPLAKGAYGEVFVCRGEGALPALVALKRLRPEWGGDEARRAGLRREAALGRRFSHPNIVTVFPTAAGGGVGTPAVVMEYVDGISLAGLLASRAAGLPLGMALRLGEQLLRALDYLHKEAVPGGPVVHGDVKPSNILLSRGATLKLADFGSALLPGDPPPTGVRGTVRYMAPEQAKGGGLSPETDQFSAALVLAEMVLGRPLYPGSDSQTLLTRVRHGELKAALDPISDMSPALSALLRRALSADPGRRFPSAGVMGDAIAALSRRTPLEAGVGAELISQALVTHPTQAASPGGGGSAEPSLLHLWARGALPGQRHAPGAFDLEAFLPRAPLELLEVDEPTAPLLDGPIPAAGIALRSPLEGLPEGGPAEASTMGGALSRLVQAFGLH